jgi:hypothetical protein
MVRVNIDERYVPIEEIRSDEAPYIAYFECLDHIFNLDSVDGVCDVGCATGLLIKRIKENYPSQTVRGIEYFGWQKESANPLIKDCIVLADMRDSLWLTAMYDIVNCTEVGEHIDPEFCPVLMHNLRKLCRKYLIMTWSRNGGILDKEHDPHCQHLNPLPYVEYVHTVKEAGFTKNESLTKAFIEEAKLHTDFKSWWLDSLVVFS